MEPRVAASHDRERRELAQKIETAQEEERRRIAADIHDDPIQVMSAVDLRLAMLAEQPETITTAALGELQSTGAPVDRAAASLVFELRPTALDSEGLVVAIDQYLARSAKNPVGPTKWSMSSPMNRSPSCGRRSIVSCRKPSRTLTSTRTRGVSVCLTTAGTG